VYFLAQSFAKATIIPGSPLAETSLEALWSNELTLGDKRKDSDSSCEDHCQKASGLLKN
jgi:hypothetical protein